VINVDTSIYQNAGANIPQQLAYSLAHMNEYINLLQQKREDLSRFHPQFVTSTGSNYFFEIAKLRALRLLYKTLAREHQLPEDCSILAQPTFRNKTLYDYNVNLLRSTTECMSAVLGGANSVSNLPYDLLFHKSSEFGERIARNQLLIMKYEAYLSKVANPTDGAYYIESLTSQFAQTALDLFKEIEDDGGFLKLLLNGNIQKAIKESAAREQEMFDRGELVLIGTNKFQNLQDSVKEQLEVNPFEPKEITGQIIEPVRPVRLSESLERERMQKEQDQPTEC
jgi:methylmalonyl-CoA mutase